MVYDASPLNCVRNGGTTLQYGLSGEVSGSCARISQLSVVRRPVLVPPWKVRPCRTRAVRLISTLFQCWVWLPKLSARVMKLFVCPNSVGATSYRPVTVFAPPFGRRESPGAVMLNVE